jgi:hypothetical protein
VPKAFDECVRKGGRVRTIKPTKGTHKPICFPKGGGPSVAGETKKTKGKK